MINLKRISVFIVLTASFVLFAALGCSTQNKPAEVIKVGEHGILHKGMKTVEHPVTPSPAEQKKKEAAERLDKSKLLYTGKVVVDSDPKMLVPIESVAKFAGKDYVIAKTPPTVEFCVVCLLYTSPSPRD